MHIFFYHSICSCNVNGVKINFLVVVLFLAYQMSCLCHGLNNSQIFCGHLGSGCHFNGVTIGSHIGYQLFMILCIIIMYMYTKCHASILIRSKESRIFSGHLGNSCNRNGVSSGYQVGYNHL